MRNTDKRMKQVLVLSTLLCASLLNPLPGLAETRTEKRGAVCIDQTLAVMMGPDYLACRTKGMSEMLKIQRARNAGETNGAGFTGTNICVEELKQLVKTAVDETRSCLTSSNQTKAADALFAYHVLWGVLMSSLTDAPASYELYAGRTEIFEELVAKRKKTYLSLIR